MNHSIQAKKKEQSKLRDLQKKKPSDQDLKETERINHLIIPDIIEEDTPILASNLSNNSASKNLFEEYVSQDEQAEKSRFW